MAALVAANASASTGVSSVAVASATGVVPPRQAFFQQDHFVENADDAATDLILEATKESLKGNGLGNGRPYATQTSIDFQRPNYTPEPSDPLQYIHNVVAHAKRQDTTTDSLASSATSASDAVTSSAASGSATSAASSNASSTSAASSSTTTASMGHTNLLAIMPSLAFSMPAQILVSGINLALISVLTIQLLFTTHYHAPLSKPNWILQVASCLFLLLNLCVTIAVVLSHENFESHQWPFMFPYLALELPPTDGSWNKTGCVFYVIMRAVTTVIIHLTHIQFLTLLFPSTLEKRLIFWLLGPLALAAAGMEFTWLSPGNNVKVVDLGAAIQNICNSTLTMLYTCGLVIWGGLVNRRRAWRPDGGTAAFGGGSMGLAIANTAMSFILIRLDRLLWLPSICWTLTIWQSWLGFWWWVGAGMGIGEVEDREEREARRKKRQARRLRKLEKEERQRRKAEQGSAADDGGTDVLSGIRRLRERLAGDSSVKGAAGTLSRRPRRGATQDEHGDEIELQVVSGHTAEEAREEIDGQDAGPHDLTGVSVVETTQGSGTSSDQVGGSGSQQGWMGRLADSMDQYQPSWLRRRMQELRRAHAAAAQRAATEQTMIRDQVLSANRTPGLRAMVGGRAEDRRPSALGVNSPNVANGLKRQSTQMMAADMPSGSRSRQASMSSGQFPSSIALAANMSPLMPSQSPQFDGNTSIGTINPFGSSNAGHADLAPSSASHRSFDAASVAARASTTGGAGAVRGNDSDNDDDWIADEDDDDDPSDEASPTTNGGATAAMPNSSPEPARSMFWRGGLQQARLRDRQHYD